ncbi:hypothetical protein QJS10_CPA08g01410 [Acorus calamus]|uniref:Uncharacterized protein n=1 Tax=Acorus calamus TaxID=4465 RepID=A0AAV9E9W2_ACOCL|nr:hypothetical protein QJS10_CPA08g01410 [Acorus calamus]
MAVKLQQQNLTLASSLNSYPSHNAIVNHLFSKEVVHIRSIVRFRVNFMQRCCLRYSRSSKFYNDHPFIGKGRRILYLPLASTDDGVTVNGMPQVSSSSELEEMRTKLDQSLQGEDLNGALIQSLHDAARAIELAIREHGSSSRIYWFSSAWLGVDKNAWVKTLSYQAAVNCLLQAAVEISSRGDGRDRDSNIFVQRSLLKQSSPLESLIREELSAKQPGAYEWFWDQQHPMVVTNFINLLERDPHFNAATTLFSRGVSSSSEKTGDISLIMLALSCIAAIMKLGPAKVSCSSFFSIMPEVTGRLMDMLIDFVPISQAYHSLKEIGLRREFLLHFGPRAAACKPKTGQSAEELASGLTSCSKNCSGLLIGKGYGRD